MKPLCDNLSRDFHRDNALQISILRVLIALILINHGTYTYSCFSMSINDDSLSRVHGSFVALYMCCFMFKHAQVQAILDAYRFSCRKGTSVLQKLEQVRSYLFFIIC